MAQKYYFSAVDYCFRYDSLLLTPNHRPSLPRGPTLVKNLRKLAKRELPLSPSAHGGDGTSCDVATIVTTKTSSTGVIGGDVSDGSDEAQGSALTEREEEQAGENGRDGGGTRGDGVALTPLSRSAHNHVLVTKERRKMGSSATLARGAFMFSLAGLCADLTKQRAAHKR